MEQQRFKPSKEKIFRERNESLYFTWRFTVLENQGGNPTDLIEAQVGSYTGEDDIARIEDDYKREDVNQKVALIGGQTRWKLFSRI